MFRVLRSNGFVFTVVGAALCAFWLPVVLLIAGR